MKIGVFIESFRTDFKTAVEKAATLGIEGIQKFGTGEELTWTKDQIREALDIVKSNGMVFSAICGDFCYGFDDPDRNPEMIEKSKRVVDLALQLETNVVTTHISRVPVEECRQKEIMRKACYELAVYADSMNASFAVETGPEKAVILADFLGSLGATGVRANFDPANLVMVAGDVAETAVKDLGKFIVHTHAKDGRKLPDGGFIELPLGMGDVHFDRYLPALASTGYNGFLTIEREVGETPEADIELAVRFLREQLATLGL